MSIKLQLPRITELKPRITVIGVGGAGGNAVNNMIASGLGGVEFVVANTDAQALSVSSAESRIQLGTHLTEGLGAGSKPEIGQAAAEEALDEIRVQVQGSHMVFIAAGMGGGTGTGAAAVIARVAKEMEILVVAIVTKPFHFEGTRRMRTAEAGIAELRQYVDTMIVIPNQNLFRIANERTTFAEAFVLADQVLYSGIACIVDLIVKEGLINLDFADVRSVLSGMGNAMMGTGEAAGDRRAIRAAEEAIANPLLDDISLKGAKGLLVSIIGDRNLTLYEVDEAASRVRQEVDPDANIIVGATFDDSLEDRVRVSIVASGMNGTTVATPQPAVASPTPPVVPNPPLATRQPAASPAAAPAAAATAPVTSILQPQSAAVVTAPSERPAAAPFAAPAAPRRQTEATARVLLSEPSSHEAEELARALAEPYSAPPRAAPQMEAVDRWESADGVTVEDGITSMVPPPAPPPLPVQRPMAGRAPSDVPAFTPQQTTEIKRPTRRMPDLEEFPEVGRRDYQAKAAPSGRAPQPPHDPGGAPRVYAPDSGSARRRPGFFERLTGRGWRDSDADSGGSEPSYPQAANRGYESGEPHRDTAPQQRPQRGVRSDSGRTSEDVDLPEFFDRKQR